MTEGELEGTTEIGNNTVVGAELDGAELDGAELDGAELEGATAEGAKVVGTGEEDEEPRRANEEIGVKGREEEDSEGEDDDGVEDEADDAEQEGEGVLGRDDDDEAEEETVSATLLSPALSSGALVPTIRTHSSSSKPQPRPASSSPPPPEPPAASNSPVHPSGTFSAAQHSVANHHQARRPNGRFMPIAQDKTAPVLECQGGTKCVAPSVEPHGFYFMCGVNGCILAVGHRDACAIPDLGKRSRSSATTTIVPPAQHKNAQHNVVEVLDKRISPPEERQGLAAHRARVLRALALLEHQAVMDVQAQPTGEAQATPSQPHASSEAGSSHDEAPRGGMRSIHVPTARQLTMGADDTEQSFQFRSVFMRLRGAPPLRNAPSTMSISTSSGRRVTFSAEQVAFIDTFVANNGAQWETLREQYIDTFQTRMAVNDLRNVWQQHVWFHRPPLREDDIPITQHQRELNEANRTPVEQWLSYFLSTYPTADSSRLVIFKPNPEPFNLFTAFCVDAKIQVQMTSTSFATVLGQLKNDGIISAKSKGVRGWRFDLTKLLASKYAEQDEAQDEPQDEPDYHAIAHEFFESQAQAQAKAQADAEAASELQALSKAEGEGKSTFNGTEAAAPDAAPPTETDTIGGGALPSALPAGWTKEERTCRPTNGGRSARRYFIFVGPRGQCARSMAEATWRAAMAEGADTSDAKAKQGDMRYLETKPEANHSAKANPGPETLGSSPGRRIWMRACNDCGNELHVRRTKCTECGSLQSSKRAVAAVIEEDAARAATAASAASSEPQALSKPQPLSQPQVLSQPQALSQPKELSQPQPQPLSQPQALSQPHELEELLSYSEEPTALEELEVATWLSGRDEPAAAPLPVPRDVWEWSLREHIHIHKEETADGRKKRKTYMEQMGMVGPLARRW